MDALDLRYMKIIRFILSTIGAWPGHVFEDSPTTKPSALTAARRYGYTRFLFTTCSIGMVCQALYLRKNRDILGFFDLGQTWLTLLLCSVFVQRAVLPVLKTYQANVKEFASNFILLHHKNKSDYSAKMSNRVNYICEIATIIGLMQIFSCTVVFNIVPLYANYKAGMISSERPINGTFEHSVKYVLPVDQNSGVWCLVIIMYNWYASYNLTSVFCCHDLLIFVMVFHVWGHLKILEHNLTSFPGPSVDINAETHVYRYTNEESKEVAAWFKEIVKHFIMIREFTARTSKTYSLTLCVYFAFHLVSGCVLLLECSSLDPDALGYGIMAFVVFQQLIQMSLVFEIIGSQGDAIIDAVYGIPWECMDNSNRRTTLILLQMAQQSLSVKAGGMVPVGVRTMAAIFRASLSYFLMLRTFADS